MRLLLPLAASTLLLASPAGAFTILLDNFTTGSVALSVASGQNQTNSTRSGQTFFSPLDPFGGSFDVGVMDVNVNTLLAPGPTGLSLNLSGGSVTTAGSAGSVGSSFQLAYGSFTSTFVEPGVLVIPIGAASGSWNLTVNINGNPTTYLINGPAGSELRLLTGAVGGISSVSIAATLLAVDPNSGTGALTVNQLTIVPEPSRALLLLGGLAPLALRRRRRS